MCRLHWILAKGGNPAIQAEIASSTETSQSQATPAPKGDPRTVWVERELARVDLGDQRLVKRVQSIVKSFYANPMASIPEACGSAAATKATYEFFDNPSVTPEAILASHRQQTLERMAAEPLILAVQDTTSLNHSRHGQIQGLGPIGTEADGPQGFFVHTTLAFTPERVPLGILDVQVWARDGEQTGQSENRRQRPLEEKESSKWPHSFQVCQRLQAELPPTRIVNIGDRESDIYELFELAHGLEAGPYLLIRAEQNRRLAEPLGEYLRSWVKKQPVRAEFQILLKQTPKRAARTATLEVRWTPVTLKPPRNGPAGRPAIPLCAILAQEVGAPEEVEPVCWMLLTNVPVQTTEEALEKIEWYCVRWEIEVFHRILKSGCQAEKRQLEEFERLERCLSLDLLVAWRIHFLTKQGREHPDLPASIVFSDEELQALYLYLEKKPLPEGVQISLGQATRMVAKLGGFLGRKGDGHPGATVLGRGLRRLHDITTGYLLARRTRPPP